MDWSSHSLVEVDPQKLSGAPVFRGTRLPIETILDNVDAFVEEGLSLDKAISETLECFPTVPGGADGIRAVLAYREAHEAQLLS